MNSLKDIEKFLMEIEEKLALLPLNMISKLDGMEKERIGRIISYLEMLGGMR